MKILISCLPYDKEKTGTAAYMRCLVDTLRAKGHEVTVVLPSVSQKSFSGYEKIICPPFFASSVLESAWHMLVLPWLSMRFDLLIIAAGHRRACLFHPIATISVVHDLAEYHGHTGWTRTRLFSQKWLLPFFAKRVDRLAAVSKSTAEDIKKYWRVSPEKIRVCYNGFSIWPSGGRGWCVRHRLTPGKYIFYNARIEYPLKNHRNLISAYEQLPQKLRDQYHLVLSGASGQNAKTVRQFAEFSPDHDRIVFTGYIANSELQEAYTSAGIYVFPSFFEGFGFPLLEAMYYSVPCACSNNSSLGEIGNGAALLFAPESPESIRDALVRILTDSVLREDLVRKGRKKAKQFTWEKHVNCLLDGFDD